MSRTPMLKIDGEALRRELLKRNLDFKTVSQEIGYDKTYISKCILNNQVSRTAAMLLDIKYDIKDADLAPREDPTANSQVARETLLFFNRLEGSIKAGIQEALMDEVTRRELCDVIYRAVKTATKEALKEE